MGENGPASTAQELISPSAMAAQAAASRRRNPLGRAGGATREVATLGQRLLLGTWSPGCGRACGWPPCPRQASGWRPSDSGPARSRPTISAMRSGHPILSGRMTAAQSSAKPALAHQYRAPREASSPRAWKRSHQVGSPALHRLDRDPHARSRMIMPRIGFSCFTC
jgi:hypothetical protein